MVTMIILGVVVSPKRTKSRNYLEPFTRIGAGISNYDHGSVWGVIIHLLILRRYS